MATACVDDRGLCAIEACEDAPVAQAAGMVPGRFKCNADETGKGIAAVPLPKDRPEET